MNSSMDRLAQRFGALFAFFGVILGAFAAHGPVHDYLVAHGSAADRWHTAVFYQLVHALAFLAVGQGSTPRRGPIILWLLGTVLFCGSLYVLALDTRQKWAIPLTPLGGVFLILGWGLLWVRLLRK